jgi:SprT protein
VTQIRDLLSDKVPSSALEYCVNLFEEAPFDFKLSRSRSSKLGDYRFDPRTGKHTVTVNADLNVYQFLITYVHEVAHRRVHDAKRRLKPHGAHWKNEFKRLLLPVMNDEVFPDEVLRPLARHMKNPKASTASDHLLFKAISKYDDASNQKRLMDLGSGDQFVLKRRSFEILEKKRTRALCLDLGNQKRYLIPLIAPVEY